MAEKRSFKGVWIPKEVWQSKNMTLQEKVFYVEIDSLDNDNGCFAQNSYFSEFFGISKTRVSLVIKSLIDKGFISSHIIYKEGSKQILKRVLKVCYRPYLTKVKDPMQQKLKDNNTVNNTINNTPIKNNTHKEKTKVFSEEVLTCYDELVILFPESTRPKDQKTKNDWCDVIDKLNRIDKIPFEIIKKITAAARNDDFWGKHFLTLPKLRKKNRDKTPYVTVFFERFKSDINPERKIDRQTESVMRKNMDIGSWLTEKEKADLTPEQRLEYGIN